MLERGLKRQIGEREIGDRRERGEIIERDRYREERDMRYMRYENKKLGER